VAVTEDALRTFDGTVLIMCGDVPLIRVETLRNFLQSHVDSRAVVSVLTVMLDDPTGYGRWCEVRQELSRQLLSTGCSGGHKGYSGNKLRHILR